MIFEKRSATIILVLGIIMIITSAIPTTILSVSIVEGCIEKKDDNNGKDKDDDQLSEYDVESLCGASEDYEAHKEQCDKLYDMLEEGVIKDDPNYDYY